MIPSSSMSPYAWIWTGPRSISPLDGLGIEPRRALGVPGSTGESLAAPPGVSPGEPGLDEDLQRQLGGTALADETGGQVQVDIREVGQLPGVRGRVSGPLELLQAPAPDELRFGVKFQFEFNRRHRGVPSADYLSFGYNDGTVVPLPGEVPVNAALIRDSYAGRQWKIAGRSSVL